jgi:two-component system, NtrC family, response regulator HydG
MNSITDPIQSKEVAELILDAMSDGVFTVDDQGRITSWNHAMECMTGFAAGEVMGKPCRLIGFDRCPGTSASQVHKHGGVCDHEYCLHHKSGHYIPVMKTERLIHGHEQHTIGMMVTVTDMSELYSTRQKADEAHRKLGEMHRFGPIIGGSHGMNALFESIQAAASSDIPALVQGATGTGKKLVVKTIHENSARKHKPFVVASCSLLPESLLECDLFGQVCGEFSGVVCDGVGRLKKANGGTLFLKDIDRISPYLQVKLLGLMHDKKAGPVGSHDIHDMDVRIIGGTPGDLAPMVQSGQFCKDLYDVLSGCFLRIPQLKQRKKDIPELVDHFIHRQCVKEGKRINGVCASAMRVLLDYSWPGNVRELENAIVHAFILRSEGTITLEDLPLTIRRLGYGSQAAGHPLSSLPGKLTRQILVDVLSQCRWDKAETGRRLGLSRASIWKYMKKWDIPLNPLSHE